MARTKRRQHITTSGNWHFETYWSMPDFTDRADEVALTSTREFVSDRPDFTFPPGDEAKASFKEALTMARKGWDEQLPATLDIAQSVTMATEELMVDTFNPVWDASGAEVDVARFLAGEPENMIDFPPTQTSKEGRVITLAIGTAISASVSADEYLRRGRGIVALALALARLGHATEIWAFDSTSCNGAKAGNTHMRVQVKGAHDEIDPAALMFALAHPAMHRALCWAVRDGFPEPWREGVSFDNFRGMPNSKVSGTELEQYPEGTIFLPGIRSDHGVPDPEEFIKDQLGKLGLLAE